MTRYLRRKIIGVGTGKGIRAVTMSPQVSQALVQGILEQSTLPFNPPAYDRTPQAILSAYDHAALMRLAVAEPAGER